MILTDFHVHSDISQDSSASMYDMVCAEAKYGIERMCFTNHCDTVDWRTMEPQPRCRQVVGLSREKLNEMIRDHGAPPIDVRLGIELGEPHFAPETAREIAASPELDFVIGSLHILKGLGDLYNIKYESKQQCEHIFDLYLDELLRIAELDWFDVMAHIGYGRRYMWKSGFDVTMSLDLYGDRIEKLLSTLIEGGRGIEINCSGIRDGCGPFPQAEVLKLYKALGGEIITVGSDAHRPEDAAKCIREGYEVLKQCGFEYITVFEKRKPEFIKI